MASVSEAQGTVLEDTVVPAEAPWSAVVREGQVLRLVDLEGCQAIDFLCFNADDRAERYHAGHSVKLNKCVYLGEGHVLWSGHIRPMMTIIADTCGPHDTMLGCCSAALNEQRYAVPDTHSCQANFERELPKHGLGPLDIHPNVNFFMYAPFGPAGEVAVAEGISKPGDYVDLRAEMDVLVVISNCPQRLNPGAGFAPSPIRAIITAGAE